MDVEKIAIFFNLDEEVCNLVWMRARAGMEEGGMKL